MKLLFFTEARLSQTNDGKVYSENESFSYQMFKRYLDVFDQVFVVARTLISLPEYIVKENNRVNHDGVEVLPLPLYIGPYQYLKKRNKLMLFLRRYIDSHPNAAAICRVPGVIGMAAARYMKRRNRPFGVEVVGDPYDVFAPGSFNHPLRAVFRYIGVKDLIAVVKSSSAVIYVTKERLQIRYPSSNNRFSSYASNVELSSHNFVDNSKKLNEKNKFSTYASDVILYPESYKVVSKELKKDETYRIIAIGSLDTMYKSPDVAIEAIALLKRNALDVSLQWLGGGRYRSKMIEHAKQVGVSDRINFLGSVGTSAEVISYLDAADLFVIPSRTEGLPRALLEAMARGLPCIGTKIGGIPELLDELALVPINNPRLLAEKISIFLTTPGLADAQAERNLKEAQKYSFNILKTERKKFYQFLKNIS
jgi:glycosyltransferase involved in cell wall biosynthesis